MECVSIPRKISPSNHRFQVCDGGDNQSLGITMPQEHWSDLIPQRMPACGGLWLVWYIGRRASAFRVRAWDPPRKGLIDIRSTSITPFPCPPER